MKKSCHLYLVRHGETDWNKKRKVQGHVDIPLNAEGEKQAHALADLLQETEIHAAFSSDLKRAHHTAEIIAKRKYLPVSTNSALRERCWGKFEGFLFDDIRLAHGPHFFKLIESFDPKPEELHPDLVTIETYAKALRRVIPVLQDIGQGHLGKNVLVVSHGGILKGILMHLGGEKYHRLIVQNTAYIHLELSDGAFTLKNTHGIVFED